ncbi:MAG: peptidase vanX D-ala-D-ala dipeptidase [Gammaproteobacteria bacterium]|jgi:D-alanyl-D-alanine dipeptidase|nr:peptidase vanX D-ala-D-ala dipeptidase [Gammaproteobacteria bacterium]
MQKQLTDLNFVDLLVIENSFIIDLPYASIHNFTQKIMYDTNARAYLRKPVAEALVMAQRKLNVQQLGLKIWDAYRPFHIQEIFWAHCPDERYIMKPVRENGQMKEGSAHNRGCAVDVTLVSTITGKELVMPTLFDDFSPAAHRDYMDCSVEAIRNRALLQEVMGSCGFIGLPTEWWHFNWHAAHEFELCDLPHY